jgi:catechol-2,3-dioxygenase
MIKGLHHNVYRCQDSEQTRMFYEDFLGLPLAVCQLIEQTATGQPVRALHTFYQLSDGSFLAFLEVPDSPFDFKPQHDFDLHIALEVDCQDLERMLDEGVKRGIEARGVSDYGVIRSIYLRDPNGYVIELTAKQPGYDEKLRPSARTAHDDLDRWQSQKTVRTGGARAGSQAEEVRS